MSPESAPARPVIGFSQRRLVRSLWWKTLVDGAAHATADKGVGFELRDASGDTNRQIEDIRALIDRGVNAVVVNPSDPRRIAPALEALSAAAIPTIIVNSSLEQPLLEKCYCYVAEDQAATGAAVGYLLAEAVAERFTAGESATTVIVGGYPWDLISDVRATGLITGYDRWLAEHPGEGVTLDLLPMAYGHWLGSDALPMMRDCIRAHPDLRVVVSLSDMMHAGISHALKAEGLYSRVVISGYDGLMAVVEEMVDDPTGPVQVIGTNEPWRQGVAAVEAALEAIAGQPAGDSRVRCVRTSAFRATDAHRFFDATRSFVSTPQ